MDVDEPFALPVGQLVCWPEADLFGRVACRDDDGLWIAWGDGQVSMIGRHEEEPDVLLEFANTLERIEGLPVYTFYDSAD